MFLIIFQNFICCKTFLYSSQFETGVIRAHKVITERWEMWKNQYFNLFYVPFTYCTVFGKLIHQSIRLIDPFLESSPSQKKNPNSFKTHFEDTILGTNPSPFSFQVKTSTCTTRLEWTEFVPIPCTNISNLRKAVGLGQQSSGITQNSSSADREKSSNDTVPMSLLKMLRKISRQSWRKKLFKRQEKWFLRMNKK